MLLVLIFRCSVLHCGPCISTLGEFFYLCVCVYYLRDHFVHVPYAFEKNAFSILALLSLFIIVVYCIHYKYIKYIYDNHIN